MPKLYPFAVLALLVALTGPIVVEYIGGLARMHAAQVAEEIQRAR